MGRTEQFGLGRFHVDASGKVRTHLPEEHDPTLPPTRALQGQLFADEGHADAESAKGAVPGSAERLEAARQLAPDAPERGAWAHVSPWTRLLSGTQFPVETLRGLAQRGVRVGTPEQLGLPKPGKFTSAYYTPHNRAVVVPGFNPLKPQFDRQGTLVHELGHAAHHAALGPRADDLYEAAAGYSPVLEGAADGLNLGTKRASSAWDGVAGGHVPTWEAPKATLNDYDLAAREPGPNHQGWGPLERAVYVASRTHVQHTGDIASVDVVPRHEKDTPSSYADRAHSELLSRLIQHPHVREALGRHQLTADGGTLWDFAQHAHQLARDTHAAARRLGVDAPGPSDQLSLFSGDAVDPGLSYKKALHVQDAARLAQHEFARPRLRDRVRRLLGGDHATPRTGPGTFRPARPV